MGTDQRYSLVCRKTTPMHRKMTFLPCTLVPQSIGWPLCSDRTYVQESVEQKAGAKWHFWFLGTPSNPLNLSRVRSTRPIHLTPHYRVKPAQDHPGSLLPLRTCPNIPMTGPLPCIYGHFWTPWAIFSPMLIHTRITQCPLDRHNLLGVLRTIDVSRAGEISGQFCTFHLFFLILDLRSKSKVHPLFRSLLQCSQKPHKTSIITFQTQNAHSFQHRTPPPHPTFWNEKKNRVFFFPHY